jgi:hypothetical protein
MGWICKHWSDEYIEKSVQIVKGLVGLNTISSGRKLIDPSSPIDG